MFFKKCRSWKPRAHLFRLPPDNAIPTLQSHPLPTLPPPLHSESEPVSNPNQPTMFDVEPSQDDSIGTRHREAFEVSFKAAKEMGLIEPIDYALASIARANAFALDAAESMGKKGVYAVSNITSPYREVLQALRMVPDDRNKEANSDLAAALAGLAAPAATSICDTETPNS